MNRTLFGRLLSAAEPHRDASTRIPGDDLKADQTSAGVTPPKD
jgi:hypothetical protein